MMDALALAVFASRIAAICEEMGAGLRQAAFSPNIRDRLDYSCAIFDAAGELCAQAAHIPVHLGSMAFAMRDIVNTRAWSANEMIILNDPYLGGTHLPDVTVIAPVFVAGQLMAFVVNRAHHASIGGSAPGSMPIATRLEDEGVVLPPTVVWRDGILCLPVLAQLAGVDPDSLGDDALHDPRMGDIAAQISANRVGLARLAGWIGQLQRDVFVERLAALNQYAEILAREALRHIPDGRYRAVDVLDDDGVGQRDIRIEVEVLVDDGMVSVDFAGTSAQVPGNVNCPLSVAAAAVFYVFRCLMPAHAPACAGIFAPIRLTAPSGSLLNAQRPAAVAAGNVETSSRVVDVLLRALAEALPARIPAASQGSMNNLAMGAQASATHSRWDYYETMGGGMGAHAMGDGLSAIQTHMTNTLNTPAEILEQHFPVRVQAYAIRSGSGGAGQYRGGDGLIRRYEFLAPAQITLLTERRRHAPWGLAGGDAGACGQNRLNDEILPGKCTRQVVAGDVLEIATPGGGGFGVAYRDANNNESGSQR